MARILASNEKDVSCNIPSILLHSIKFNHTESMATVVKERTSTLSDSAGLTSAFSSRDLIFMWYNVLIYVYNIYELEAAEATFSRPYLFDILT